MDTINYFIFGIFLSFVVGRPIAKYRAREYCKNNRLIIDLPKLKWYRWWL